MHVPTDRINKINPWLEQQSSISDNLASIKQLCVGLYHLLDDRGGNDWLLQIIHTVAPWYWINLTAIKPSDYNHLSLRAYITHCTHPLC